ncbi:UNVERIFIED_CONTAM: hypothetical protein HDU68_001045 [Siphonaria sp. JEL0065]|nr:hypothetical protein HDU68_001045 [Siphonaria sp. JEL0065]
MRIHIWGFTLVLVVIASVAKAGCPIKEKCPYAKYTPSSHENSPDCPLKLAGCPYYETHAKDKSLADFLTEKDGKCPLSETCPFYAAVKEGKKIDLSGSLCPLKDKCPYYKTIKSHGDALDCPLEKSCPYLKSHKTRDDGKDETAEKASCPYADKHKECPYYKEHAGQDGGCPLKDGGCPYYKDVKSGRDIKLSEDDAEKCPYYKEAKEAKKCPHLNKDASAGAEPSKECPYLKKQESVSSDVEVAPAKECPLKGKCPYVGNHHVKHSGEGCPLKKGGCPYYSEHANDGDVVDLLQHEGGCPLKEKCPYYDAIKKGEKVDLSGQKCPLAEKCPYYKDVKDHGAADCPLEKGCPHFKKDFEKGGHAHHAGKYDSHEAKDCPYIKKHKTNPADAKPTSHDEL